MVGKLIGTGSYLPSKVLTNDDISKMVETSDEWILERTGIKTRYITEDDTTTTMAVKASKKAIIDSGISSDDLDMIIVATLTPDVLVPNVSSYVQESLSAVNAQCMDVNSACTGFLLGYQIAQSYIQLGAAKNVLVVGSENLSAITNFKDRSNCIIFGDGAGACVLTASEGEIVSAMHSDGSRGKVLECDARTPKDWKEKERDKLTYIRMEGQEVFKFATKEVPNVINEVLAKSNVSIDDITKKLKIDKEKVPSNISKYGNTSSASIPILIDEMNRAGKFKDGQKVIIAGFGGGLSWGASYINI